MKFYTSLIALAGVSSSALANVLPRQGTTTSSVVVLPTTTATRVVAATTSTSSVPVVAVTPTPTPTPTLTPVPDGETTTTFNTVLSFAATNPTAVNLVFITASAPVQATVTLKANLIPTPGTLPPISGAPKLPSWNYTAGTFPALDVIPDVNSTQVAKWMQEVANSGITIPNYSPTIDDADCASNAAAAADASRCWWSCGQCSRSTDITTCPNKFTWGVSFDDGPSPYTTDLLNYMDDVSLKSTFFIVGSRAISRPELVQAEYMAGHQLSVHTWSHHALTTLTNAQIIAELGWTREAIRQITGVSPNTMRPPYGDIDDRVRAISLAMGMTPIIWTTTGETEFDTNDWHIPSGESVYEAVDIFDGILTLASTLNTGFIVLAHDLYQQSVDLAIGYILPDAIARTNPKYNLMSIVECQNKPLGDAYVETNNNSTNPFSSNAVPFTGSLAVSATPASGTTHAITPHPMATSGSARSRVANVIGTGAVAIVVLGCAMILA